MDPIQFNRVAVAGNELEYTRFAIDDGRLAGAGPFSKKCEALLQNVVGVKSALLTTSCTDALEMSAILLDLQSGDEVIVPSFTFVSSINAFILRGARPVFVDIRPDTLNLDEQLLAERITSRTKAIVPVHYGGVGCEMDVIMDLARGRGLAVVEDNAHGLFGTYKGKQLGTFGAMATQSFHETKNFTSGGEGGALLINDPQYIERAEIIREKGTDRTRFQRGQVDKYTWRDIGSSFLPSDLLAAFLLAQLEQREAIQAKRQQIWHSYANGLEAWASDNGVKLPEVPEYCGQPAHLFYLLMPTDEQRDRFIDHMRAHDIYTVFHYLPLHLSPMGERYGGRPGDCPVTEDVSARLVRLPLHGHMTDSDVDRVIETTIGFKN